VNVKTVFTSLPRQVVDDYCPPESGTEVVDGWPTMFECEKVQKGTYVTLEKRTQGEPYI
jgi:hypothetical protein